MNSTKGCPYPVALAWLVIASILSAITLSAATTVTRGPYLQQGGTNSIVVRWRTSVATASLVRYGTAPGSLTGLISNAAVLVDHIVPISGLQPDTKYFYEVGTATGWFTGDTNDFFVTAPPTGTRKATRIWVLGDSGYPGAEANAVRNAYTAFTGARPTDLWLMLGDNAYEDGTDAEHQAAVFDTYPTFLQNSVLWPTLGNHEVNSTDSSGQPPYYAIFTLPQNAEAGGVPSGTEKYYSFDYANIHFVCLDSMSSDRKSTGPMCNWLRADLAATTQEWLIAFFHHPPYSKGSHDSDDDVESIEMRQNVLPILEGEGVDLVLCGHSHSYERSFLLDGHYGSSTTLTPSMKKNAGNGRVNGTGAYVKSAIIPGHEGAVYSVAGSSSEAHGGDLNHPAMFTSLNLLGSLVIDVSSNRLDCVFLKTDVTAGDWFTIIKATPPPSITTPLASTAVPIGSNVVLSVTAVGGLPLDYYWLKDSVPLDVPNSGILPIFNAQLSHGGLYQVVVSNAWGTATSAVAVLTVLTSFDPISLAQALDTTNMVWTTTGSPAWEGHYSTSHDGLDAARSGSLVDGATASLQTTLTGPGSLAFWWKVSSETNADYLTLFFGTSQQARISGGVEWEQRTFNVPAGTQVVRWAYSKNGSAFSGQDRGWVDQVQFTPQPVAITNQPVARSVDAGSTVTFSVGAAGTPPLSYQWQRNGSPLIESATVRGAATATLTLSNVQPAQSGNYSVLVSNATGGVGSSNALLTVTPFISLAEALDGTNLAWTTNGTPPWTGQDLVTYDGADAARSGAIGNSTTTYIQTTVNGPGTVTFRWKVSSQTNSDLLLFLVGGTERARLSGEVSWRLTNFSVAAGSQQLRWTYSKNGSTVAGQDRAWVDQVTYERLPAPVAPGNLTATPASISRIDLAWADGSTNESAFLVERSTNGTTYTQVATLGSNVTTYANTGLLAGATYQYRVRATNAGGASAYTAAIGASTLAFTSARINFQPASAPVPVGYLVDGGLVYGDRGNGLVYGWNSSRTSSATDRNSSRSLDQRYDTFIGTSSSTRWELGVPNGNYNVFLVVGDASASSGTYKHGVEGVMVVNGVANSANRWVSGRANVTVGDGRLTLTNIPGASSVPLCFIEVVKFVPLLTCQPNKTVECGSAWDFNPPGTATDPCGGSNIAVIVAGTVTNVAGACGMSVTRTWRAVDGCGNTNLCSQTVSVVDTAAPVLAGVPAAATVECDAIPAPATPTAADNCGGTVAITYAQVRTNGNCANRYTLTRTWTATDACGNTSSRSQVLTVVDLTPPVLAGVPGDAAVQCDAIPAPATPTASDNCGGAVAITYAQVRTDGDCADRYTLTRTWTATDACDNTSSQSQVLTVADTTAPVLAGVPGDAAVQCDAIPAPATPTASDNCGGAVAITYAEVRTDGDCANRYTLTRTWTATDACGNTSSQSQVLPVVDLTPPVLAGVPADAPVECSAIPTPATPTASDNCGGEVAITYAEVRTDGDCANRYTLTRTWTATDVCGNASSQSQVLTVADTTAPVLAGVPADAPVECSAIPTPATPTASDNCGGEVAITYAEVRTDGDCANRYTLTRTWTATDVCGNASSQSQVLSVADTTAPVLAGVPADAPVECSAIPTPATPTASDNCGGDVAITYAEVRTDGDCANRYTLTRTWTATDVCGNASSQSQVLTVVDTTAPEILCGDIVTCDPTLAVIPDVRDSCDPAPQLSCLRSDDLALATAFPVGTTAVTCTGVDACGNSSMCLFTVTVLAPLDASGPADQTVLAGSDVVLTTAVIGSGPLSCVWKFNGDVIPGATTASLVLQNVLLAASGIYCVEVTGPCNLDTNCATLTVLDLHIELCTMTQNFYADTNRLFGGVPTLDLLTNLLSAGPLILGKPGARSVTIGTEDAVALNVRLPAGGPAAELADVGDQLLAALPLNGKGRLDNDLLGQTLTLALNCRLDPALTSFVPASLLCTRDVEGVDSYGIPASLLESMVSPAVGVSDETVAGLLELANRGLAGLLTGGPTLAEIHQALEAVNAAFDSCRTLVTCSPLASLTPVNDDFATRTMVSGAVTVSGRNVVATAEPGEPPHAITAAGKTVWWQWTPSQSGTARIRTQGSSFDTVLAVYAGQAFGEFTLVEANDDFGAGVWSEVEFAVVAGTPYQIAVDGYAGDSGTVILTISEALPP